MLKRQEEDDPGEVVGLREGLEFSRGRITRGIENNLL